MESGDWFLVIGSVVLGQFALLGIEFGRGLLERRQRRNDRRDDFRRDTLIDLQDSLDELSRIAWEAYAYPQRKQLVPNELSRDHRVATGRVQRLAARVDDEWVRENVSAALRGFSEAVRQSYPIGSGSGEYPHAAGATLESLDESLTLINDRIGDLLRRL